MWVQDFWYNVTKENLDAFSDQSCANSSIAGILEDVFGGVDKIRFTHNANELTLHCLKPYGR